MTDQMDLFMSQYKVGNRVEIHPACDCWMQGDRFGKIVEMGKFYIYVKMDRSKLTRRFTSEKILRKV